MRTNPARLSSRPLLLLAGLAAAIALGGCVRQSGIAGTDTPVRILTPSTAWQAGVEPEEFRRRLATLTRALERLREETGSGWIGRQDDVTGYLRELRGGHFFGGGDPEEVASSLLRDHGTDLFGVSDAQVSFREEGEADETGRRVLRGEQRQGDVPVLDGSLVATVAQAGEDPRLTSLRGRVFPGISTDTEPGITSADATRIVEDASGGRRERPARLVIMPLAPGGTLAWEVEVAGATNLGEELGTAVYYVDAVSGDILSIRPGGEDAGLVRLARSAGALAEQPASGEAVEVTGTGPIGEELSATATRNEDGTVTLVDTTTGIHDPATGAGAISVHDATGMTPDTSHNLPGPAVASDDTQVDDAEALAALAYTRAVHDYYFEVHGRRSWDNEGGSYIGSVHFGAPEFCNAYFDGAQMVYGVPCVREGQAQVSTFVDVDVVGHEITHGVDNTSSSLNYVAQSGALDESHADYFGNVVGNRVKGIDGAELGEGTCEGLSGPTSSCEESPEGGFTFRYLLNGATMDEYLYLLNPAFVQKVLGVKNDSGGVHLNSAIWNNALWSIRSRLAQIDGTTGNDSPLAQAFDRVVYASYTQHLTSTSGFLDARHGLEQAAVELGVDPTIGRVIREVMDQSRICDGCVGADRSPVIRVAATVPPQMLPVVSGDRIAWLDLADSLGAAGAVMIGGADGREATNVSGAPNVLSVGFAGDSLVFVGFDERVTRLDPAAGTSQVLDEQLGDCILPGVGGSDEGAAWVSCAEELVKYVGRDGAVVTAPLGIGDDFPVAIGAGGGTVAVGTEGGQVVAWKPGVDQPRVIGTVGETIYSIDAHGDRVVVTSTDPTIHPDERPRDVTLFDLGGQSTVLSPSGTPFGVAISDRYVVWSQRTGELRGRVAEQAAALAVDSDLYLHSFSTGRTYLVARGRGQEGFPDISGNRLVWQDAGGGGDDIVTGMLPDGL